MRKKRLALICCIFFGAYANAQGKHTPFQHVFDVIAAPQIYGSTSDNLFERLAPWCAASTSRSDNEIIEYGNVECREAVSASSFRVSTGSDRLVSIIAASFNGAGKCSYMKKRLIETYGKPSTVKGACGLEWWLKTPKGKPQRYIAMQSSGLDDKVYFSIGEEQGP